LSQQRLHRAKVRQKRCHFRITQFYSVTFFMEENEAPNPIDMRLFRAA
jgi:hypothetical protein